MKKMYKYIITCTFIVLMFLSIIPANKTVLSARENPLSYSVAESDNAGYVVHSTNEKGVIKEEETIYVKYTNTKGIIPKTGID